MREYLKEDIFEEDTSDIELFSKIYQTLINSTI